MAYCPNCGTRNNPGARFCTNCGNSLDVSSHNEQFEKVTHTPVSTDSQPRRDNLFKPGPILFSGLLFSPLLPAIFTSINLKRRGLTKVWGWTLLSGIIGLVALICAYGIFEIPFKVCIVVNFVISCLFYSFEKRLIANEKLNENVLKKGERYRKVSIALTVIFTFFIAWSLYHTFNSATEIIFGTGLNADGSIAGETHEFTLDQPITIGFNKFVGSLKASSVRITLLDQENNENLIHSFDVEVDPTWEGVFLDLKPGCVDDIGFGKYILRIFIQDKLVAEGNFQIE